MKTERWAISLDECSGFDGDYASRKDAIKSGIAEFDGDVFYVGKARPPAPLSSGINAESLIECLIEGPLEEDWFTELSEDWQPTSEQHKDLETRLKAAIDQWVDANGLEPYWFLCDDIERIDPLRLE